MIIGLVGELGSGKTTYVQQKAKELGITETVTSPTFVLLKIYKIPSGEFERMVHMDVYRLKNEQEFKDLNIDDMLNNPKNLVMIEWADKVKNLLPKDTTWTEFHHEK